MRVTLLEAVLLVLAASPARADASDPPLDSYTSAHYVIYTNLTREEAVPFGRHMDAVFEEYSRRFKDFDRGRKGDPMPLYLFRTQEQYVGFLGGHHINAAHTGGMFFVQPDLQGLATWTQGKSLTDTFEVLQHEGFHQFAFNYIGPSLPIWVNEGLAQYFEDGILVGDQFYLGLANGRRIASVKSALDAGKAIDIDRMLAMSDKAWHETVASGSAEAGLLYDQAWSMVYFLITAEGGKYRDAFGKYLMLVAQRRDSAAAFAEAFGSPDTAPFRARWEEFAREVQPDGMAVAIDRMEVLGQALRFLAERNERLPTTTEQLRSRLQRMGFYATRYEPGRVTKVNANDEALYRFTNQQGKEAFFQMLDPEGPGLLPRLTAPGLVPQPTLVWRRDATGQLVQDIVFK